MTRLVGPLDKRWGRKRCSNCIKAHLKCDGCDPCHQCVGLSKECLRSNPRQHISQGLLIVELQRSALLVKEIPAKICTDWESRCITHFFESFFQQHDFIGQSHDQARDLQRYFHSSPHLRNAVLALSSLDLEIHKDIVNGSRSRAVDHYGDAISALRSELNRRDAKRRDDDVLLWTTLLLAIFELMHDVSGNGFLCHFVGGTSTILQARGPGHFIKSGNCRVLQMARMLEIVRAVTFWTDTFLEEEQWQFAFKVLSENEGIAGSDALESILKLVGRLITLHHRTVPILINIAPTNLEHHHIDQLRRASIEGFDIRHALESWYDSFACYFATTTEGEPSTHISNTKIPFSPISARFGPNYLLSQIYYNTIFLALASIFEPYPHFFYLSLPVPSLTPTETQVIVNASLCLLSYTLRHSTLAGFLLLWPIRAAGARSVDSDQMRCVLEMLGGVERRGFVVARGFEARLRDKWIKKGRGGLI